MIQNQIADRIRPSYEKYYKGLVCPFAIEPVTGVMLPDGIFDNAIYSLQIACHYTNQSSGALKNGELYPESVGDPGVVPVAHTFFFPSVPAGASVLVQWDVNFQQATPGKRPVSFIAKANSYTSRRPIQQIFVSQTRHNNATNTCTCAAEETGAHEVISALWEVDDNSTTRLMNRLYAEVSRGSPPDSALRDGKLALLHSASCTKSRFIGRPSRCTADCKRPDRQEPSSREAFVPHVGAVSEGPRASH